MHAFIKETPAMTEENLRKAKEITISEDEYRKWDKYIMHNKIITEGDPFTTAIPSIPKAPEFRGRISVTLADGRENWGPLCDIQEGDVVIIKRPGLTTDKRLKCLKIDGNEVELQDLWQKDTAKKE